MCSCPFFSSLLLRLTAVSSAMLYVAHQQESTPLFVALPIVIFLAAFVLYLIWNKKIIKNKSNF